MIQRVGMLGQPRAIGRQVWNILTAPHPDLTDEKERWQARLFAALHLPLPLLYLFFVVIRSYGYSSLASNAGFITYGLFGVTLLTYGLSRTRHYKVGIILANVAVLAMIIGVVLIDGTVQSAQTMPLYFAHAILFATFFLSPVPVLMLVILTAAAFVLFGALHAGVDFSNQLRFLLVLYSMFGVSTGIRYYQDRQIAEKARRVHESEAAYRSLFEATFEPLLIHDGAGNIVMANPAMEQVLGRHGADLARVPLTALVAEADRERLMVLFKHERPRRDVFQLVRHDGTTFAADISSKPHIMNTRVLRLLSIRDLTSQQAAEAERVELALARERQVVQQKLIRNLSHDFRTPLAVIKTSLYLLERQADDPVKHRKNLDVVRLQTQRLQEMMDDFITLARLDLALKTDVLADARSIDGNIGAVVAEHQAQAVKRGVNLQYRVDKSEIIGAVDVEAVERITKSLISNALAFTPAGGSVDVELHAHGERLTLCVTDTGMGIRHEDLPHIFDPFFRADPTRNSDKGGAGLGLTIAQKLTHVLEGHIEVKSVVGQGSTFTVHLPLAPLSAIADEESLDMFESTPD